MENIEEILDGDLDQTFTKSKLLYIPTNRLIVMSILSLGLYQAYWMYKNWKYFKDKGRPNIMPFWRAMFSIFFCHSLFNSIKDDPDLNDIVRADFNADSLATTWIVLSVLSNLISRMENTTISLLATLVSLITFIFLLPVQNYINSVNESSQYRTEYHNWSTGHNVCLVFGIIFWALIIIGLTLS